MPKINAELPPAFDLGEDNEEYVPAGYGSGTGSHPFETPLRLKVEITVEDFSDGVRYQFFHSPIFSILMILNIMFFVIMLIILPSGLLGSVVCSAFLCLIFMLCTLGFIHNVFSSGKKYYKRIMELSDGQIPITTIDFDCYGFRSKDHIFEERIKWEAFQLVKNPVRQNGKVLLLFIPPTGLLFQNIPRRALPPDWTLEKLENSLKQAMECVETGRLGMADQMGKQE